jgi:hypothetical protein
MTPRNRRLVARLVACLVGISGVVAVSAPRLARAEMLPEPGEIVSGRLTLFGKPIPLPSGNWRVVAASFGKVVGDPPGPGPYGSIGSVLLIRPVGHPDPAFLLIRTNALPVRGGWGPTPECLDDQAPFHFAALPRGRHNACAFVVAARASRIASLAGASVIDTALPPVALVAGLRASDRNDVIELRYGVIPPDLRPAAWLGDPEALDAPHREIAAQLGAWARQSTEAALAALRDPVDQVPPIRAPTLRPPTDEAPESEELAALRLQLYDMATNRAPQTAWNFALASALAGDLAVGATIALWQSAAHNMVSTANETAWEPPLALPPMNFVAGAPVAVPPVATAPVATQGVAVTRDPPAVQTTPPPFAINGKQVPLPDGSWAILAEERPTAGPRGIILGQLDGKALLGLVVIHSNTHRTAEIFGAAADCSRTDIYFARIRYDTPFDGFCSYGKPIALAAVGATEPLNPLWDTARRRLVDAGVRLPTTLMMVGARARTTGNFIDARYYFAPDRAMMAAGLSGELLAADTVGAMPPVLERVAALQAWADLLQLPLERGVRGRLGADEATLPWPWPGAAVKDALVQQAHAPLLALRAAGAFDDAELQRQLALADAMLVERERQRWSLWQRSAYQATTYRVASYVGALAVSWIITASPAQTVAYATINAVAQPIMAYVNAAGSGTAQPAATTPVNFPEIGGDQR